jgi:dihydrofolate synthase/folylpolyglutamate synthase
MINERFCIGFDPISSDELVYLLNLLKPLVDEMIESGMTPTYFELCTGIAFQFFKERKVDLAVVEVGLGGRFDATNVVNPLVSVITNVSDDHQHVLGESLEDIAFEKAGIIKEEVPIITAAVDEANDVIQKIAGEFHAPYRHVSGESWRRIVVDSQVQCFQISGVFQEYRVETRQLGELQGENIAVTLAVIESLQQQGRYISEQAIFDGVREMVHPGRMEVIQHDPLVLLDGAHNTAGVKGLVSMLNHDVCFRRLVLIVGILKDKKVRSMLRLLLPVADVVITVGSFNPRSLDAESLADIIFEIDADQQVYVSEDLSDAIGYARSCAKNDDIICVTGSLFLVGEARIVLFNGMF